MVIELASTLSTVPTRLIALLPCAIAGTARSAIKLRRRRVLDRMVWFLEFRGRRIPRLPPSTTDRPATHEGGGSRPKFIAFWALAEALGGQNASRSVFRGRKSDSGLVWERPGRRGGHIHPNE